MVRSVCKDIAFLRKKALPAGKADLSLGSDLLDTLKANSAHCVGMAANMIGVNKAIIVVDFGFTSVVMYNPKIIGRSGPYECEEGCLSLTGMRKARRYQNIELEYQDSDFKKVAMKYAGYVAQIIQHEMDHLEGIII